MTPLALPRAGAPGVDRPVGLGIFARAVDPAGLAAFRVLFGLLVAVGAARFLSSGTVDKLYREGSFHFRYPGFSWVPVPSPEVVEALYGAFLALGALIAVGLLFRLATALFALLFAWVQLIDVTNYLNHNYLVVLLAVVLLVTPAHACWSLDARFLGARRAAVPSFFVALLRFQVACVYVHAALAKVGEDWLLYGQPLGLWLPARDELPVLGPLLAVPAVPLVLSWGGFLYDAAIVPLLLWRRTRPLAYVLVLVFHGLTAVFFEIGMFPFIMAVATTAFFEPSYPRRLVPALGATAAAVPAGGTMAVPRGLVAAALLWCTFHAVFPLRCHVLGDDVLWDEAGMRFSWRVMVREKSGALSYRVTRADGSVVEVSPHELLTHRQVNEMIGQPDMILQLAHHIRDRFAAQGDKVEVRADARVSLNGRPLARFIDPTIDLAALDDTVRRAPFVLPAPAGPPRTSWLR